MDSLNFAYTKPNNDKIWNTMEKYAIMKRVVKQGGATWQN